MTRAPGPRLVSGTLILLALFSAAFGMSYLAIRAYRAAGVQPFFYQSNFEPAVLMACGRGFGVSPAPSTELIDFLQSRRNALDCKEVAALPSRPLTLTANANWYYLYGSAAALWRVTGVSWTSLDILVAAFAGTATVLVYGLFRLVAGPAAAFLLALLLTLAPSNLLRLLSLRDYSKAPFVLAAILILGVIVMRPMSRVRLLAMAALYGAVVGIGYGFRGDLAVMVPFGAAIVLCFPPGDIKGHIGRNAVAAAVLLATFLIVAAPVLAGLSTGGGCQYHFALLGLTTPSTSEMHLTTPLYRFGDHALDVFGNLKVGDYTTRVLHQPLNAWCDAKFDTASGRLYMALAKTFPADFAVRAYGSVLMILRLGLAISAGWAPWPFPASAGMAAVFQTLDTITAPLAHLGTFATLAAIAVAFAVSWRTGLALAVFVLFLTGYPAIRFEERHWFHLRFIPWWAAALVIGQMLRRGLRGWERPALARAAVGVVGLLAALAVALAVLRMVQTRSVRTLIAQYLAAPTEEIAVEHRDSQVLAVRWQPRDYGNGTEHQASDLIVVTLDAAHCTGAGPVRLMVRYDFDTQDGGHDLSTAFTLERPGIGAEPTRVFIPVFWAGIHNQTFLRFSGFEIAGAPTACLGRVARVIDGASLPLWLEMQVPADWAARPLYQAIEPPRVLKMLFKGSL